MGWLVEKLCKEKQLFFVVITNKQQCGKMCFCLPPALGEEGRMLPRTSAPRRGGESQSRDSTAACKKSAWGLVLHLSDQWICRHLPPCARVGSDTRPWVGLPQLQHQHASLGTPPQVATCSTALQNEACRNREKGLGQSPAQHAAPPRKCNPSFLSQKLFASVLSDSCYFINSINFLHRLLRLTFAFEPG